MYIINSFLSSTPLVIPFLSIQLFSPLQARFFPVVDSTLLRANEARISRPRTSVQGQVRGSQRYESTDKVDGRKVYKRTRQLQRRAQTRPVQAAAMRADCPPPPLCTGVPGTSVNSSSNWGMSAVHPWALTTVRVCTDGNTSVLDGQ